MLAVSRPATKLSFHTLAKKFVRQPEQRALARPIVANQANAPLIKAKRGNRKNRRSACRTTTYSKMVLAVVAGARSRSRRWAPALDMPRPYNSPL